MHNKIFIQKGTTQLRTGQLVRYYAFLRATYSMAKLVRYYALNHVQRLVPRLSMAGMTPTSNRCYVLCLRRGRDREHPRDIQTNMADK